MFAAPVPYAYFHHMPFMRPPHYRHPAGDGESCGSDDHAAEERSNILAERYKTKMCRNYTAAGHCPYESRCMFAHGDHELRTTEMNIRDGLFSEEAIRSFQRAMVLRARQAQRASFVYRHDPYAANVLPYVVPLSDDGRLTAEDSDAPTKTLPGHSAMEP